MKGFKKIGVSNEYVPEERAMPLFAKEHCVASAPGCEITLFYTGQALRDVDRHIGWLKYTSDNIREQGGYMLGNVYRDPETKKLYGIVSRLVPMYEAKGTAIRLDMSLDAAWAAGELEAQIIEETRDEMGVCLRRIGWYHTHPNSLSVFMSGDDMAVQSTAYYQDWQFAVVLNPHKGIWRAFHGREAEEVNCVFVCNPKIKGTDIFRSARATEQRISVLKKPTSQKIPVLEKPVGWKIPVLEKPTGWKIPILGGLAGQRISVPTGSIVQGIPIQAGSPPWPFPGMWHYGMNMQDTDENKEVDEPSAEPDKTKELSAEPDKTKEPSAEPDKTKEPSAELDKTKEPSAEPDKTPKSPAEANKTGAHRNSGQRKRAANRANTGARKKKKRKKSRK